MNNANKEIEQALTQAPAVSAEEVDRATERAIAAAHEAGAVDMSYTVTDSPVGELLMATTDRGLVRLIWLEPGLDALLAELAEKVSPRVVEASAPLDEPRRQLEQYFEGSRKDFDLPLDLALVSGFRRRALRSLAKVPYGELTTYRAVATSAGNEKAVRAAGSAVGANPVPIVLPCHRVVRTGGGLGGYAGGLDRKRFLLTLEGSLEDGV